MSGLEGNRLLAVTHELHRRGEIGVAPYVTAGDGGFARTLMVLEALEQAGASCVELGVPFSDPVADGPVLQRAAARALGQGANLDGVIDCVRRFRERGGRMPLIAFSYLNPLLSGGIERRLDELAGAGCDGVLIPDVPVEEAPQLSAAAEQRGLALSLFCAPTTSATRLREAARQTRGFLYVVGRVGVTGRATELGSATEQSLDEVRAAAPGIPLGVGFGLRTASDVARLRGQAELAIVGSALVDAIHAASLGLDPASADPIAARTAGEFVTSLLEGAAGPRT